MSRVTIRHLNQVLPLKLQRRLPGASPHSPGPRALHARGAPRSPGALPHAGRGSLTQRNSPTSQLMLPQIPNSAQQLGDCGSLGVPAQLPARSRRCCSCYLHPVSFPAPHFLPRTSFSRNSHTKFLLEMGSNLASEKQQTCLGAAPPTRSRWLGSAPPPTGRKHFLGDRG